MDEYRVPGSYGCAEEMKIVADFLRGIIGAEKERHWSTVILKIGPGCARMFDGLVGEGMSPQAAEEMIPRVVAEMLKGRQDRNVAWDKEWERKKKKQEKKRKRRQKSK